MAYLGDPRLSPGGWLSPSHCEIAVQSAIENYRLSDGSAALCDLRPGLSQWMQLMIASAAEHTSCSAVTRTTRPPQITLLECRPASCAGIWNISDTVCSGWKSIAVRTSTPVSLMFSIVASDQPLESVSRICAGSEA